MISCSNLKGPTPASCLVAMFAFGLAAPAMLVLSQAPVRADDVTLVETGSTLLYPLFKVWASEYAKTHPGVRITTAATAPGFRASKTSSIVALTRAGGLDAKSARTFSAAGT